MSPGCPQCLPWCIELEASGNSMHGVFVCLTALSQGCCVHLPLLAQGSMAAEAQEDFALLRVEKELGGGKEALEAARWETPPEPCLSLQSGTRTPTMARDLGEEEYFGRRISRKVQNILPCCGAGLLFHSCPHVQFALVSDGETQTPAWPSHL